MADLSILVASAKRVTLKKYIWKCKKIKYWFQFSGARLLSVSAEVSCFSFSCRDLSPGLNPREMGREREREREGERDREINWRLNLAGIRKWDICARYQSMRLRDRWGKMKTATYQQLSSRGLFEFSVFGKVNTFQKWSWMMKRSHYSPLCTNVKNKLFRMCQLDVTAICFLHCHSLK